MLHNDQGTNPRRIKNNMTYICTQRRSTSVYKANANSHKGKLHSNTIKLEGFNTSLIPMGRSSRKKVNKKTQALNDTLVQIDIVYIHRIFHPKAAECACKCT